MSSTDKIEVIQSPTPFVKWVGGKRQLIGELTKRLPASFERYCEPFIGGGALMWSLVARDGLKVFISDSNAELINLYRVVRDTPDLLLETLGVHENTEQYYYDIRLMDRDGRIDGLSRVERASRFLYLNKAGYNGLYRVNKQGQNNVPFGRYKTLNLANAENIYRCSSALQNTKIRCGEFDSIANMVREGDFVYLDPPYAPLTATASFTGYTAKGFDADMQRRLKVFCDGLNAKGVKFMLSNSSASLIYDLYADYTICEVGARRSVNSDGGNRGKVVELLVRNYD